MSDEDKTLLRHAALGVLTARHPNALTLAGIRRRAERQVDFPVEDAALGSALALLVDMRLVQSEPDPFGSILYYRATAAGLLATERGAA